MSAINATNSLSNTSSTTGASDAFSSMSTQEFVNIMIEELSNQDPFEPNDSAAILEQLSSIRNIESQMSLQNQMETLVTQNAISSSSGMIGKYVNGLNKSGTEIEGIVTSLRVEDGEPVLMVDTGEATAKKLPADSVQQVYDIGDADSATIQQLLASLQALNSSSLIGKNIVGVDDNDLRVEGRVMQVQLSDGEILLKLDSGETLPISQVKTFGETSDE